MATTQLPTHAVLNCHVTQVLGLYATGREADAAAKGFGNCSFAYELTEAEAATMLEAEKEVGAMP